MQITLENVDQLNAIVRIKVEQADYTNEVEKELKNLRNKAFVPGFRPGKVPPGMIKKMYGKSVISDEVGKAVVKALYDYLENEKIKYLGDPLMNREQQEIDWDRSEFDFVYDIGLMPAFDIKLPEGASFTYHMIRVDDEVLEKEVNYLRERYGRSINADEVAEKDMVSGEIVELDETGNPKPEGLNKTTYFFLDRVHDEALREELVGKKPGDVIELDPRKAYKDNMSISIYLGIKEDEVDALSDRFRFTIQSISRVVAADMEQEFFDRVFGEGQVNSEEEFKERVSSYLKADLQSESTAKLFNEIREQILSLNRIALPDEFLKRWIIISNTDNKEFDPANIEEEYAKGQDGIRWEVIRTKIVEDNNIQLPEEEILAEARRSVVNRLSRMGYSVSDERIDELARRLLTNRDEARKIVNYLYEMKALEWMKNTIRVNEEEIGYNEFLAVLDAQRVAQAAE